MRVPLLLLLPSLALVTACGPSLTPSTGVVPAPVGSAETPYAKGPPVVAADVESLRSLRMMVPVDNVAPRQVPNSYDAKRGVRTHEALDIMAPKGTPVVAAVDGFIARLATNDLGGITIYQVDRDERWVFYYAHLDRYARGLAEGQRVSQGEVIGYVGTTGNAPANAPHLHFQVMKLVDQRTWWAGPPLNPHPFLAQPGRAR